MKKLNIVFCSFPDFCGNSKVLFEYINKNYKNKFNLIWAVHSTESFEKLNTSGINSIVIGTDEFYNEIKKTDVFFTTHANLTGDKQKAPNAIYVELWHGIGPKPVGYLANKMLESDKEWYHEISLDIDYLIVPSEFWKIVFAAQFNINAKKIKSLGLPILDEIVNAKGKENLNKILNINVEQYNKIIMYLPTFRKGCGREEKVIYSDNTIFNINDYQDEQLIEFLKENNYLLIVKRHPSEEHKYKIIENEYIKNIDNEMLNKYLLNINSILNAADIVITDYSSVGTEFLFLDRPTIYISTDLKEYKDERGIILGNYHFWTENQECNSFKDLIKLIQNSKKEYISKNKELFYGNLKDSGCKNICEYFFDNNYKLKCNIKRNDDYGEKIYQYQKEMKKQKEEIENKNHQINELKQELEKVYNSKGWKMLEKIRKIRNNKKRGDI